MPGLGDLTPAQLNRFILNQEAIAEQKKQALKVDACAGGNCAQGAFDYNVNYVSPYLQTTPIRQSLQDAVPAIANSEYSIPSGHNYGNEPGYEYQHNNSIDSWELYNVYNNTDAGSVLWDQSQQGEFDPTNYGNIPLGAVITQGSTTKRWDPRTDPNNGDYDSHTTTVIGFNEEGVPLVYDSGHILPLGEALHDGYNINNIFVPKGYDEFTYGNINQRIKDYNTELGYLDAQGNPVGNAANSYSRYYINDIKNSLDANEQKLGEAYGIPKSLMDKIQNRVIGLGAQESNFNELGDEETSLGAQIKTSVMDNEFFNYFLKPTAKLAADTFNIESEGGMQDWEVEILAKQALEAEGKTVDVNSEEFKNKYNELRAANPKVDKDTDNYDSSRGPYKIKNFSEKGQKLLGLDEGDLTLVGGDVDELRNGANAAAVHLIEDYKNLKTKYPNLSDDQLLDLATIAYNNKSKVNSQDFVDNYIKSGILHDSYLDKVKAFELKYLDQQKKQMAAGGLIQNNSNMTQAEYNKRLNAMMANLPKAKETTVGGQIGAGTAGVAKGIVGSLLPGQLGSMANQGIDAIHGALDKNISDEEKAIAGWGQSAGAIGTAIATGGASLATGADDIAAGASQGLTHGTGNWGKENAGAINTIGSLAGMAGGMAAGNIGQGSPTAGQSTNMEGMLSMGQGAEGSDAFASMAQGFAPQGGTQIMTQGNTGAFDMGQLGSQLLTQGQGTPLNFGYGGRMPYANGGLMHIENGGTHEQNALGGVPMGPNASVEQGETVMNMDDMSKFVFSDRLKEGKKTFADQSKSIEKKFKDREGDAAATRAKNQMLRELAQRQETMKQAKMAKLQAKMAELSGQPQENLQQPAAQMPGMVPQMGNGGRIQYGPGGRAATGYSLPAGLAANQIGDFQKFALTQGANLGNFGNKGVDSVYGKMTQDAWNKYGDAYHRAVASNAWPNVNAGAAGTPGAGAINVPTMTTTVPVPAGTVATSANTNAAGLTPQQIANQQSYDAEYNKIMREHEAQQLAEEQAKHVRNRNLSIGAGALLNSAGDIYGLVQGIRGPEEINLERLNPDLISLAKQREIARRNAAGSQAVLREGLRSSGASGTANLSALAAGNAAVDSNLANILTQSMLDEEVRNTGILNAAEQANQQIDTKEQQLNMEAEARAQEAIQTGLHGIGANAAGALKDVRMSNQVDVNNETQMNAMNAILQDFVIGRNGEIAFKDGTKATQEDIAAALAGQKRKKK